MSTRAGSKAGELGSPGTPLPAPTLSRAEDKARGDRGGIPNLDIWKLKLDGTGSDAQRLTYFNDFAGFKASNPVVATDGSFMAFQIARSGDAAGVGYGILLYNFK